MFNLESFIQSGSVDQYMYIENEYVPKIGLQNCYETIANSPANSLFIDMLGSKENPQEELLYIQEILSYYFHQEKSLFFKNCKLNTIGNTIYIKADFYNNMGSINLVIDVDKMLIASAVNKNNLVTKRILLFDKLECLMQAYIENNHQTNLKTTFDQNTILIKSTTSPKYSIKKDSLNAEELDFSIYQLLFTSLELEMDLSKILPNVFGDEEQIRNGPVAFNHI